MDLKNWYDRVREQLDRLDFPALWAGFAPCPFALYTHDTAVLNGEVMPRPAEFYGNTSVCRQGEYLAIWNMEADPPADVAGLAASLVHEMFHSFQFRCGEQGWPDDLVLAAAEPQPAFLALRAQEHRALAGGAPLSEVLALRQSRAALQPELLLEEARMETIEGTAEYVGRLALARLSPAACEGACARSAQRLLQWPDLRRGAYDSGPWLLRRAAEEGLPMPVHPGGEPIADQLARQLSLPEVRLQPELLAEAERRLERERSARRVMLQTLLETAERTEGSFAVCGYLKANAYMVRTAGNADFIREIDAGIKKEVSISCSARSHTCSICGKDRRLTGCPHVQGELYQGMLCHTILSDITDAYEWSFVAVPAQRNAGVTKQYGGSADHDRITVLQKQLQSQQAQLSAAEEDIRKELVTLCYLSGQPLQKSLLQAAERMTFPELLDLRQQLRNEVRSTGNSQLQPAEEKAKATASLQQFQMK